MGYLLVFLGGGLGATLRHGVNVAVTRWLRSDYPYHTLFVNASGSFVMGVLVGYFALKGEVAQLRLFLTTGLLGGYTTFSAFSMETVLLWERGQGLAAASYVVASVGASLAGMLAGLMLVRQLV
jgi:fluoride exporter